MPANTNYVAKATGTEAAMSATDTIRTYESFEIRWINEDGSTSTWTNYDQTQAEATVAYAAANSGRTGEVIRKTFEVLVPAARRHIFKGEFIAERNA